MPLNSPRRRPNSVVLLMFLLVPSSVFADDSKPLGSREFHHQTRMVTFGGSLGLGEAWQAEGWHVLDTGHAYEADVHLGRMLSDRVALMFEGQVNLLANGLMFDQHAAMAAAQFWLLPSMWIKGGVGIAGISGHADNVTPGTSLRVGYALLGAIGFELVWTQTFAIDVQARFGDGLYDDGFERFESWTLGSGISWY